MTRDFFRDIWRLARPYWFSDDRWPALGLLAVIVAMSLGMVFINVLFNKWYGDFYNALQNHDIALFVSSHVMLYRYDKVLRTYSIL